jgi:HK97 family phage portal protein
MFNLFRKFKSEPRVPERKYAYYPDEYGSFVENIFKSSKGNMSIYRELEYYRRCAPLHSAIQLIADEVSNVTPYMFNPSNSEYVDKSALLELLKFPNADVTYTEFMKQLVSFFLVTGNVYIVARAVGANRPVADLFVIPPQYVTITPGVDGFAQMFEVSSTSGLGDQFMRNEINGRFRYYSKDGDELWHIKEFNPLVSSSNLYGMSRLTPIVYEIEQYIQASTHNLSMLRRGARPSGALTSDNPLNDDQFTRLQEQMTSFYQGAGNTGRLLLLENGLKFEEMAQTNKDMDFLELKKNVTNMIYNAFKIPLPLISPEHMTLNNMTTSMLNLYDNAVLPLMQRMFNELTIFLLHRYPEHKNMIISYSDDEITALEPRRNEQLEKQSKMGILTINEIRALMGYEPLTGGDVLYINANQMAIAQDADTQDLPKTPAPRDGREELDEKEQFIALMRAQRNPDNTPRFSENYIFEMAEKHYGNS